MSGHVERRVEGRVGVIQLSRPDKFNAIGEQAVDAIRAAVEAFEAPGSGVRVILINSSGPHFCTGADLDESRGRIADADKLRGFLERVHETLGRLESSPLPVVGACQGYALAGGLELLLACDVVIAARNARFGDQHVQYGLVPAWGGSQRLPRLIGLRRSLDLMYSGRWIDAETALGWGLVNQVTPDDTLVETALDYCHRLAARSRPGTSAMKALARQGLGTSLEAGLRMERERVMEAMAGPDVTEGLAAFEARREPSFKA